MVKKDQKDLIRMTELATKAGLPWATLKFYVEQKLLSSKQKTKGGYRLFDEREGLRRIAEIRRLQETKRLTIAEIKKRF